MSNRDIETLRSELLKNRIELSDTLSQLVEKCNNNFTAIVEWGGGPVGEKGEDGNQGVPTKPKVPIHVWKEGVEYNTEIKVFEQDNDVEYELEIIDESILEDSKYQSGHLIILKNAHVYILEADTTNNYKLHPTFLMALQSYDTNAVVDGKKAYVHFAYANTPDGSGDSFITDKQLRDEEKENIEDEPITTFSLRNYSLRNSTSTTETVFEYIGVYSDNMPKSSDNPNSYTWIKLRGDIGPQGIQGIQGIQGVKGDTGDNFTGQPYTVDLEGVISTISIGIDRTRLYNGDNCECTLHAYYGNKNVQIHHSDISVNLPEGYTYTQEGQATGDIVLSSNRNSKVGRISAGSSNKNDKDTIITFTPDESFVFPKNNINFTIHIKTIINDENDGNTYDFDRDVVWSIKGIESTFELEIVPQYRTIKLTETNTYYPETLLVDVYKVENGERYLFNFNENPTFTLLYKDHSSNTWLPYNSNGVNVKNLSCVEFKVVRYYGTSDEEMWDYEDVWVVADGKGSHYYHADLGATESMMVLTTGEKVTITTNNEQIECADIKNEYSITFDPKFYDGTENIAVKNIAIANSGIANSYMREGTLGVELDKNTCTLTITRVPYGIEVIPMLFEITGNCPKYDDNHKIIGYFDKKDTVSFNIYVSTLSDIYTLVPTVSSYNTSTGKNGDTIGCNVYKNNTLIVTNDLNKNGLTLKYAVHDSNPANKVIKDYMTPIVFGKDNNVNGGNFASKDIAIEFILLYRGKEVYKSTVPLIKDGIDGSQGEQGKQGKTVYPAGKWDTNVTYNSTENTTPYVVYNDEYWQLVVDSSVGAEPGNSSDWIKFEKFEAIFAKIGIIENGLFGSAVFNGNYMFSQYGIDADGNPTDEYQNFDPENPYGDDAAFKPNICIDFSTGETHIGNHNIVSTNDSKCGYIGGVKYPAIKWDDKNIYISSNDSYTSSVSSFYDANNGLVLEKSTGNILKNSLTKKYSHINMKEVLDYNGNNTGFTLRYTLNGQEIFINVDNSVNINPKLLFYNFEKTGYEPCDLSGFCNIILQYPEEEGKVADIILKYNGKKLDGGYSNILFNYYIGDTSIYWDSIKILLKHTNIVRFRNGYNFYSVYYIDGEMVVFNKDEHFAKIHDTIWEEDWYQ